MNLVETIRHGRYTSRRELKLLQDQPVSAALDALLVNSPYYWDMSARNREEVAYTVEATGVAMHGWADYTLEEVR
ncbi:hypothetical protein ACXZ66_11135 [Corynebacterium sp. S7]